MVTRNVVVNLIANVGPYIGGVQRAGVATTAFRMGALGLVAGLGAAVSKASEFESAMSQVEGATRAGGAELEALRETAKRAGAETQYSATEAADAITEMAKAGISAADIMNGALDGALALAAAGQMDVAEAAGIASVAMTQFKLTGEDIPHVADLLAAGANKAMGEVSDLGQALNQSGLIASAAGLSLEETTATLSAFASAGLIGSDAGTSLKTMLQRLQNPSKEAAAQMSELGISMYDANGEFVGMEALAGQLKDGMSSMTPAARDAAMAVIFGSDAVRAANVLYAEGAEGIATWTSEVDEAGYAQEQAGIVTDNLKGDLERLGGAWDTLLINLGEGAQGPLRELVQGFTGIIDVVGSLITWFTELPGPVLAGVGALTALMLINGPLAGAIGNSAMALAGWYGRAVAAAGGAGIASVAMAGLRGAMAATMTLMGGPLGLAIVGLTVGLGFLIPALSDSESGSEDLAGAQRGLADAIRQTGGVIDDTVRSQAALAAEEAGLMDWADTWGVASGDIIDAALGNEEAIQRVADAAAAYEESQTGLTEQTTLGTAAIGSNTAASQSHLDALLALTGTTRDSIADENERAAALNETAAAEAEAAAVAADWTNALHYIGDTTGWTEEQIESATDSVTKWRDELAGVSGAFVEPLDVYKSQIQQLAQATADATEDSSDSWSDYEANTTASLDEVARQLEEQVLAQQNWRTNIVLATQRGGLEVGQALAAMGQEGAGLVQQLVDSTDEDFSRMAALLVEDARLGGAGAAAEMDAQMRVMAEIAAQGAGATVQGLAAQLGIGVDVVRSIASQYGVQLAEGVNPILAAVGEPTMNLFRYNGPYMPNADGNLYERHQAEIAPGGAWRVWAEPETGGEAYIPLSPAKRRRSLDIWRETGERLGVPGVEFFARGGFASVAAVPRPASTAPTRPPISTAGDGTMLKAYNAVTAWLPQHLEPPPGSGGSSTGLLPIMAAARQYAMAVYGIGNVGGFSRRNIAGTNTLSDHALGKAIDIMTTNLPLGWQIANDFAFGRAHKLFNAENVIWQQSISSNGGRFTGMEDRGSPTQNHRDHVHVDTYRTGTPYVPRDGFAYLHEGEAVVPKLINARSREWSGAAMSGATGGSVRSVQYGDINLTTNPDDARIARVVKQVLHEREVLTSPWN